MSGTTNRNYVRATGRLRLKMAGFEFTQFSKVDIARDLQDIAGTFALDCVDEARLRQALPVWLGNGTTKQQAIIAGLGVELLIDDETVLIGWIEKLSLKWSASKIECHMAGRDRTGDLVECGALPDGPAEFKNVDLLHVARHVCDPFGIPVRADVDIGAPFERLAAAPHESALAFLEKAARQRSVLMTSDGVGGLLLTRGGKTRAPAPLTAGDNVLDIGVDHDWTHRFSRYIVKGQTGHAHGGSAVLDHSVEPLDGDDPAPSAPGSASGAAAHSIVMTGEARDPEVTRYRPVVRVVRTQAGSSSVQEQAEWALRVAKGQSEQVHITVLDWRDGPKRDLWRPNQVVLVSDPYSGLDKDMLIAGVAFSFGADGMKTALRLAGVTAFDRINEPQHRRQRHHKQDERHVLDSSLAPPLKAK